MREGQNRMRLCFALLLTLCLSACASAPHYETLDVSQGSARSVFRVSPTNSYGIVFKGKVYDCEPGANIFIPVERLPQIATVVSDTFVDSDLEQTSFLLRHKQFDVYQPETVAQLDALLAQIGQVSNAETRLFLAYSGEGRRTGLLTQLYNLNGHAISPPATIIKPEWLLDKLEAIRGVQCVLLNACESGVFPAEAAKREKFRGVIIAACDVGYATTPCESTGTSAIYAAFFKLYEKPSKIHNLAHAGITCNYAGSPWSNLRHRWVDFWDNSGLPISYNPVIFSNANFLL